MYGEIPHLASPNQEKYRLIGIVGNRFLCSSPATPLFVVKTDIKPVNMLGGNNINMNSMTMIFDYIEHGIKGYFL